MEYYNIETKKGWVKCYEVKGVYHCLNESDIGIFNKEDIISIEICEEENARM